MNKYINDHPGLAVPLMTSAQLDLEMYCIYNSFRWYHEFDGEDAWIKATPAIVGDPQDRGQTYADKVNAYANNYNDGSSGNDPHTTLQVCP